MSKDIIAMNNVAILPNSNSIYEKLSASTNPRDIADDYSFNNPFIENTIHRGEMIVGDDIIITDGPDNLFPQRWKNLIQQDSIMPGLLRQKIDLLLSGGLKIFVEKKVDDKVIHDEIIDHKVSDFLDSINIDDYIGRLATDYVYVERCASFMVPNMASRISSLSNLANIATIKHIPIENIRIGKKVSLYDDFYKFFISDWGLWNHQVDRFSAFNPADPFADVSIMYKFMPSFCSDYYGRPSTIGVANYLSLKLLLLNNTADGIVNAPFRYHIESPQEYWDNIKSTNGWTEQEIDDYEADVLRAMDDFLKANDGKNAMKRFHTKFKLSDYGKERLGWSIKTLEDKTQDRTDANFKVFEKINEHVIAALSLDPAISNIQIQGKLSSGLDKLTAFNIHMLINTPQPRKFILAAINAAIKVNFWKGDYRPKVEFRNLQLSTTNKEVLKEEDNKN